jgi:hypothetical protein
MARRRTASVCDYTAVGLVLSELLSNRLWNYPS